MRERDSLRSNIHNIVEGQLVVCTNLSNSFGVIIPTLMAHVAEYDEYWRRRAQESLNNTLKAYHPEPENITASVNMAVHE
ncbi:hypothetical protein Leryth_014959 [Lithospermum erythrorhizon]|nr:hypothetical protein Leryth_014959 [Lithospermum erythrorhizon]